VLQDEEVRRIRGFGDFLHSNIVADSLSSEDQDFYKRTTKKLVAVREMQADILDQFD